MDPNARESIDPASQICGCRGHSDFVFLMLGWLHGPVSSAITQGPPLRRVPSWGFKADILSKSLVILLSCLHFVSDVF